MQAIFLAFTTGPIASYVAINFFSDFSDISLDKDSCLGVLTTFLVLVTSA
jgi:hypothetical protein